MWLKGNFANYAESLHEGDQLSVRFSLSLNSGPNDIVINQLVGGSNHIIMQNGEFKEDWAERHPRTAIGINADSTRLYFVVVDGRHLTSTGVTLKEMYGIFEALGAVHAVNLDGGGSSCMVVNGEVMNHPSDGSVRAVGNGCLFVSTAPEDDGIGMISFEPRCYNLSIAATTTFGVWGYNQYGVLKTRNLEGCTFSCDEQVGYFDEEGAFHASAEPAQGNLYVTYNGITASQPVTIMEAQWLLVSDSVVIDQFHPYTININGISGYSLDKVDPAVVPWMSFDQEVCTVDERGIITAVADGRTHVSSDHPMLADSLLVRVENPKARLTTLENGPIVADTWTVAQSGGNNRVVTALDNGLQIDFTGSSSRNPYIKISKDLTFWGIPDSIRLRMIPGDMTLKSVKIMIEDAYGDRVAADYPVPDDVEGMVTIDAPISDLCNAADMGSFPLKLIYIHISHQAVTVGESYSFKVPGMELVYDAMPPVEPALPGDVDGDGAITIADINLVIDMILSGTYNGLGDVNGDGNVNISDINALIAVILY